MSYMKEIDKAEKRIDEYWSTEEIDIDLANEIVADCQKLILDVKELKDTLKHQAMTIAMYIAFQNITGEELEKEEYYRLIKIWSKKVSDELAK